ncbi:MAG: hypothetical protein KA436_09220 [Oligoflexales bacterium]|nr:hypothetical protein [Oligoflexales bacterium]
MSSSRSGSKSKLAPEQRIQNIAFPKKASELLSHNTSAHKIILTFLLLSSLIMIYPTASQDLFAVHSEALNNSELSLPDDLKTLVAAEPEQTSNHELAFQTIDKLNQDKTDIYGRNLKTFQKNLLKNHPVILALFSSKGGRFILYRPGMPALQAPSVPRAYELVKTIGHSTLALYSLLVPFAGSATKNTAWKKAIIPFLENNRKALDSLSDLDASVSMDIKSEAKSILEGNIAFMEEVLKKDSVEVSDLRTYGAKQGQGIKSMQKQASSLQVTHWVSVMNQWKNLLGKDFDKTYAVANAVYVTRSRNVLFTVLAQFFREEAIGDRLFLFETTDFDISPDAILAELTRVVSDRAVGYLFFKGKYEMDVELLGTATRVALQDIEKELPGPLVLPPLKKSEELQSRWPW